MLDQAKLDEAETAGEQAAADEESTAPVKDLTAWRSRLHDALRRARLNEAERSDVILDLRDAEYARLELLQDSLKDVVADIPPGTDLIECSLVPGSPPRLWVDVLAYVAMGRDKRTYRFVKETRYGPKVILETSNAEEMSGSVTDYVAHRLLERERALASDTLEPRRPEAKVEVPEAGPANTAPERRRKRFGWFALFIALVLGGLVGAAGLFGAGLYLVSLS